MGTAGRHLWRHWPVMIVVLLIGLGLRSAAIYLAVIVSRDANWLTALVLPLAVLALLAAIVLAMRALDPSLRWATISTGGGRSKAQQRLALLSSVLIPLLAVYYAQGWFLDDVMSFFRMAADDETATALGSGGPIDYDLLGMGADFRIMAALVVLALVRGGCWAPPG